MGKRILIVEDEKDMADVIRQLLEREGYHIDIAYDGEEGLEKIKATMPDLVLLDVMLPKLDGRDLLKIVKNDKDLMGIPILMVSARSEQWDRELGLELGAEEYVEKPLDSARLLRKISNIFTKKR
ncbi:MAG: response regulator [Candidatus Omnitrophica bacterium]|nr:response regulator [Candidatus Omnitrophota bacterium]